MTRTAFRSVREQPIGACGNARRAALLESLAVHLAATPWHRASVPAVTRGCGVSPAAFYQYFDGVAEAVCELVAGLRARGERVPEHLELIRGLIDFEETRDA